MKTYILNIRVNPDARRETEKTHELRQRVQWRKTAEKMRKEKESRGRETWRYKQTERKREKERERERERKKTQDSISFLQRCDQPAF